MNAKDMKPGMVVAIKMHDPYYNPIKAEIVIVGGQTPSFESTAQKPIAHKVKILTGSNKDGTFNLVGKQIMREWQQEDEDRYLSLKGQYMQREIKVAKLEAMKVERGQLVESLVSKLEVLGINAGRSSAYIQQSNGEHEYLPVIVINDPEKISAIIDQHIKESFQMTTLTEDLND